MAAITTRAGKGSALTHNEVDANFTNLNNDKLEGTLITNNSFLARTNGGVLAAVTVAVDTLVGRLTGGEIAPLPTAQVKTLLAYAITDISGLDTALGNRALQTSLDSAVADIATHLGYFNGYKLVAQGTATLVAGTVPVAFAGFAAGDMVQCTPQTGGVNTGVLYKSAQIEGESFTITSTNGADTCTFFYQVWRAIA